MKAFFKSFKHMLSLDFLLFALFFVPLFGMVLLAAPPQYCVIFCK